MTTSEHILDTSLNNTVENAPNNTDFEEITMIQKKGEDDNNTDR